MWSRRHMWRCQCLANLFFVVSIAPGDPILMKDAVRHVRLQKYCVATSPGAIFPRAAGGYSVNTRFPEFPCRLLREVYMTTKFVDIAVDQIQSICFVFTPAQLKEPRYHWSSGMQNVYALRFGIHLNHSRPAIVIDEDAESVHIPFPKLSLNDAFCGRLCSECIWNRLFQIYRCVQAILSCWSEKQGHYSRASKLLNFNCPEVYFYITKICDRYNVTKRRGYMKKSHVLTCSGMKRYRKQSKNVGSTTLRFETVDHLAVMTKFIIGVTGRFGVRMHPPTLKDIHRQMFEKHHALNYINGASEPESPYRPQTTNVGVDLIFYSSGHRRVNVRYRRYLYSLDANGNPINCPCPTLLDVLLHLPQNVPLINTNDTVEEDNDAGEDYNNDCSTLASNNDPSSVQSMFQPGTFMRDTKTRAVFKITKVTSSDIVAVAIDNCHDLTINPRETKTFSRNDHSVCAAIKDYYK
ncbi:hypothetical protein ACA910_009070 [Epithemia clementina (nom. ined.)]